MILFVIIVALLELAILTHLANKIRNTYEISLKDTAVYPFILVLGVVVFFAAYVQYGGFECWWESIPCAFSSALELVVLDIDTAMIKTLAANDVGLLINYLLLYVISTLALLSLSISLLRVTISNAFRVMVFKKEVNYVVNLNDDAKTYLKNLTESQRKNTCVVLNKIEGQKYNAERLFLHSLKIKYVVAPFGDQDSFEKTMRKLTRFSNRKKYSVVLFENEDQELLQFTTYAKAFLQKYNLFESNLQFVAMTDDHKQAIVEELLSNNISCKDESHGCIRTFNKHSAAAFDFIMHNNFAKYFPRELVNTNATIKDCDINLFVLGFGKFNQSILKDVLIQTQFATVRGGKLAPQRLEVHVYDDHDGYFNLPLSCGILKYQKSNFNQEHYFELPEDYASHVHWHMRQKADGKFICSVYDAIRKQSRKKPQVNYFLISTGDDCVNLQLTHKLNESLENLDSVSNTFFTRVQTSKTVPCKHNNVVYFGKENDVLKYDTVVADSVYRLSKIASCAYNNNQKFTNETWSQLTPIKQQSNVYLVAGIPFKLALLGINDFAISREELFEIYDPTNQRENYAYSTKLSGDAQNLTARDVLAFVEHERWNAFELSVGAMPMKKQWAYQNDNTNKTPNELYHLCLTTSHGLTQYHDYFVEQLQRPNEADVIHYDYQLFDTVCKNIDLLKKNN